MFTSDNGPEGYAYARDREYGHWSAAPLRGLKRDLHEGGHRVPMIVRYAGVTRPGSRTAALASQVDLFATLAEAVGAPLPDDAPAARGADYQDSRSLMPVLRGKDAAGREFIVHNTYEDQYALRSGDRLLVDAKTGHHSRVDPAWLAAHDTPPEIGRPHLYNLADDPGQRVDLAADRPAEVAALRAELAAARTPLRPVTIAPAAVTPAGSPPAR